MGNQSATFCCKNKWLNPDTLSADKLKMLNDLDYGADQSEQDYEEQRRTTGSGRISGTSTIMF